MSVEWRIKHLQEELQKLKDLPEDRKFRCKNCGQTFEKHFAFQRDAHEEDLCYNCERKLKKAGAQKKAEEDLLGTKVVDLKIKDDNPSELYSLVLAKDLKKFTLTVGGWDEHYISVEEEEV